MGHRLLGLPGFGGRLSQGGSPYAEWALERTFIPDAEGLFLYPPGSSAAFIPATWLSLAQASTLHYLAKTTAIVLACLLMPVRLPIRLVSIGVAAMSLAVLRDLQVGNVSSVLVLPTVLAWRWLDRPAGSVALALGMWVRSTFGIFLVWQALRRAWHPLLWTLTAGLLLVLLSLPLVGWDAYAEYLRLLGNVSVAGDLDSADLAGTARALGIDDEVAWAANAVAWAIALAAVLISLRRDPQVGFMVTLVASILLGPLTWEHYPALILLPAAFVAGRGRRWAMLLPLLTWLPRETLVFVTFAALLLPFAVPDGEDAQAPAVAPGARAMGTP